MEGAGACHGLSVHDVCMLSVEDLPTIKDQGCMIANKFDIKVDANAIMCTVKEIRELTMNYTVGKTQNNV